MNVNNSGTDGEQGGQNSQPMQGPEAAAKRDVEEAERKAEEARVRADELEEQLQDIQDEYEQLREEHEEALDALDTYLDYLFENANFGIGKSPKKKGSLKEDVAEKVKGKLSDINPVSE
jgi:chromosome segregation ATPase